MQKSLTPIITDFLGYLELVQSKGKQKSTLTQSCSARYLLPV